MKHFNVKIPTDENLENIIEVDNDFEVQAVGKYVAIERVKLSLNPKFDREGKYWRRINQVMTIQSFPSTQMLQILTLIQQELQDMEERIKNPKVPRSQCKLQQLTQVMKTRQIYSSKNSDWQWI